MSPFLKFVDELHNSQASTKKCLNWLLNKILRRELSREILCKA